MSDTAPSFNGMDSGSPDAMTPELPRPESVVVIDSPSDELALFVSADALAGIRECIEHLPGLEIGGLLLGRHGTVDGQPAVFVDNWLNAEEAESNPSYVRFTHEAWADLRNRLERHHPGAEIVGWFHTHPKDGVFLSSSDLFMQQSIFDQPWHLALVLDPRNDDHAWFHWHKHQIVRADGYYLVEEPAAETHAPADAAPPEDFTAGQEESESENAQESTMADNAIPSLFPELNAPPAVEPEPEPALTAAETPENAAVEDEEPSTPTLEDQAAAEPEQTAPEPQPAEPSEEPMEEVPAAAATVEESAPEDSAASAEAEEAEPPAAEPDQAAEPAAAENAAIPEWLLHPAESIDDDAEGAAASSAFHFPLDVRDTIIAVLAVLCILLAVGYRRHQAETVPITKAITTTAPTVHSGNDNEAVIADLRSQVKQLQAELAAAQKAAKTQPVKAVKVSGKPYTVQDGDSLWKISMHFFNDAAHIDDIARVNGLAEDASLKPGMQLLIPVEQQ